MARKKRNRAPAVDPVRTIAVPRSDSRDIWILLALALATLAVYAQVAGHQFIHFDDEGYIFANPMVSAGWTQRGVLWAFTTFHQSNWHPLTWLSHMIDVQLFGLNAGGHLFVNALIHSANASLLFLFLQRVTGARWRSALVAAFFALHPLHVESVAWAAERKDTLSTFFGLLCLHAYARYVGNPSWKKGTLVALTLAGGLMAKPMLVSWPFVLLLLDYWPLRRLTWRPATGLKGFVKDGWPLLREKLPLFCLILPSMVVTHFAQSQGGSVADFNAAPFSWRLGNALVSYAKYLGLTFWPTDLAIFYPFPAGGVATWKVALAVLLLTLISVVALREARRRPYLLVGWLWFLGTLIPVIGLVQVGAQAMADRYHYIPSIGLFIAVVFGLADLATSLRLGRATIAAAALSAVVILAGLTARQVGWWRDSVSLFERTLAVTSNNVLAQYNLACALYAQEKYAESVPHFAEALRLKPDHVRSLANMGMALRKLGRPAEGLGYYERAAQIQPNSVKVRWQRGLVLADLGRNEDALREFARAVELSPNDFSMRMDLGLFLTRQSRLTEAAAQLKEAVRIAPENAEAHNNLGLVLLMAGRPEESLPNFSAALRLKPDLTIAQENLHRAQKQIEARPK